MKARHGKETILCLILATACGGNTVDLGHGGGGSGWLDVSEGGGDPNLPQTVFETDAQRIFGVAANDTTLFTLLGTADSVELVACAVSGCAGSPRVIYRETTHDAQTLSPTPILQVGSWLFWMLGNGNPGRIAGCPVSGCDTPVFVESWLDSGWIGGLAGDEEHVYWIDTDRKLLKLAPGEAAAGVVRQMTEIPQTARLVANGDFVHFTQLGGGAIYRVRKDGSTDAELVKREDQLTGVDAAADSLFFSTQSLTGSIFSCSLGGGSCEPTTLATNQRWPAGVRTDGETLFWANGFAAGSTSRSGSVSATLWSCGLPDCADPRLRAGDLQLSEEQLGGTVLQASMFTFSRDFVFWLESTFFQRARIRRLSR